MYQFLHIESYSLVSPKKGKQGGHSVSTIIAEASRAPLSSPHISEPKAPIYLYGKKLEDVEAACKRWASSLSEVTGRKTRKDALCLLAGVISAPRAMEGERWEKFKGEALQWLRNKYGDQLHTVVEHTDEDNPHIHFYVIPATNKKFDSIHDGKHAVSKKLKDPKGIQNRAYKASMRAMLDDFNECVGLPNGMLRYGPKRRRLTRKGWKEEKAKALGFMAEHETIKREKQTLELQKSKAHADLMAAYHRAVSNGFKSGVEQFGENGFFKKSLLLASFRRTEISRLRNQVDALSREVEGWKNRAQALRERAKDYFNRWRLEVSKYSNAANKLESMASAGVDVAELQAELSNVRYELKMERRRRETAEIYLHANDAHKERNEFPESAQKWLVKNELGCEVSR